MIYYISPDGAEIDELALLQVVFNSSFVLYQIIKLYLKSKKKLETITLVVTVIILFIVLFTSYLLTKRIFQNYQIEKFENVLVNIVISLSFVIVLLGSAYLIVKKELEDQIIKNEELKRAYLERKLETMQNQIKPHFLYNTLNVLVGLIRINQDSAAELVLILSSFYRRIFDASKIWSLQDELELCEDYLRIMKFRFGSRLEFEIQSNLSSLKEIQIPSLVVHTFVENAITHNIAKNDTNGKIKIKVAKTENVITINVIDGKEIEDMEVEQSIIKETSGSKLAESKLREFFGNNYTLQMRKIKNPEKIDDYFKGMKEGFEVTIVLKSGD